MAILEVRELEVQIGATTVLRGVTFDLEEGHTLGIAGESGCGKSITAFSIMGMLPRNGRVVKGSIKLEGRELVGLPEKELRRIRGKEIALVMQDPFTSLNPMMRVGDQIAETIRLHRNMTKAEAKQKAIELLSQVGVPAPESSALKYPHQMSGGQRQRIVIAMAFACKPKVLIADEPTTALDVTLQAQILRLIQKLKDEEKVAVMLISHDIGAIASIASKMAVFYAGKIIEEGSAESVLVRPSMPYTQALLAALPSEGAERLAAISGQPPSFASLPVGCAFSPRCPYKSDPCAVEPELRPVSKADALANHRSACWFSREELEKARASQASSGAGSPC